MQPSSKDLAAAALEAMPQAVLVVDAHGDVLARNASASAMLCPGEAVETVLRVEEPDDFSWPRLLRELDESTGRVVRRNVQVHKGDGTRMLCDIQLCLLPEATAESGAVVIVEDVSARVSAEMRMAAGERMSAVGRVVSQVAHELNNPLDGVMRYVGLAQRTAGAEASRYLDGARTGLHRMAEIVRGLLNSATGNVESEKGPIEKMLEEAVAVMRPRADALGVAVLCDFAGEASVPVPGELFQVFCNIIKNALDAMPHGGRLTISQRREGESCTVSFADTGEGFSAEDVPHIFTPFYTTKSAGEGSGLGLAICREILTRLGGSISAAPGETGGAVFTVTVPSPNVSWRGGAGNGNGGSRHG